MKKLHYFLVLICLVMINFSSCKDMLGIEGDLTPIHDSIENVVVVTDTVKEIVPDTIIAPGDTVKIEVHDTVYVDTTGHDPHEVVESYHLTGGKTDNGWNYTVYHESDYAVDDEVVLRANLNRSAEITGVLDSSFVSKTASLQATVGRPNVTSDYDVNGEYDIDIEYKDYPIMADDGWSCKFSAENQSASAMYEGKRKYLLYLKDVGIKVQSVKDEMTTDTLIRGKKIYFRSKRTVVVEQDSRVRPMMGQEIANRDTLRATFSNVFIEVGDVQEDTVPVNPPDTVPVTPPDTVPVTPPDPVVPDDGYTVDDEKIESISFSYTIAPSKNLKEVLLVRFKTYVMPIVDRQILAPVSVANPNDYNSAVWNGSGWVPADLRLDQGFVWYVNGSAVAAATDATIDWLARSTGISNITRGDFLKDATFVNEGTTTRVYVDNVLYMTLSK